MNQTAPAPRAAPATQAPPALESPPIPAIPTAQPPRPPAQPAAQDLRRAPGAPDGGRSAAAPAAIAYPQTIKSFVRRAGRTTSGQARAVAQLGPRFVLPFVRSAPGGAPFDAAAAFGRSAPLVLEIGFGMGEASAQIAALQPHTDYLCCEVHEPGVGALLARIREQRLANIRIVQHDAVEVVEHMLAPASLAGVHIFFPDPWPKKRHHKRRLLQPALAERLAALLAPGGYLHCATDWQPYAEHMLQVLGSEPLLRNQAEGGGYSRRPHWRPLTKFEHRGLRLGHEVWDVLFLRCG